ncbi:hypothetical protein BJF78_15710 [Pseudonocardia sp. CNS-139]|nr:hypothetical protein BJF78_15710 [Pseudonocardia sp. CNS-139]
MIRRRGARTTVGFSVEGWEIECCAAPPALAERARRSLAFVPAPSPAFTGRVERVLVEVHADRT